MLDNTIYSRNDIYILLYSNIRVFDFYVLRRRIWPLSCQESEDKTQKKIDGKINLSNVSSQFEKKLIRRPVFFVSMMIYKKVKNLYTREGVERIGSLGSVGNRRATLKRRISSRVPYRPPSSLFGAWGSIRTKDPTILVSSSEPVRNHSRCYRGNSAGSKLD